MKKKKLKKLKNKKVLVRNIKKTKTKTNKKPLVRNIKKTKTKTNKKPLVRNIKKTKTKTNKKPLVRNIKKTKTKTNKKPLVRNIKKTKTKTNKKPLVRNIKKTKTKTNKKPLVRNIKKTKTKKILFGTKKDKKKIKKIRYSSKNLLLKIVKLQEKLKPKFNLKLYFNLEKYIQGFFQKIADKIEEYKDIKAEEKRRRQLQEINRIQKEKIVEDRKTEQEKKIKLDEIKKELKNEEKIERERAKDIKLFLRKEQAIIRKEQAEKQRKFLEELKIEKQIEKFRIREIKELETLEKVSLKEQREDYAGLQKRIESLKEKYRIIRDQKIRERVEALGVQVQDGDNREALLQKEKEHRLERQKIENCLESFYRSASSLVFQLNKRHITRHMSIFRCIDRRFETGEIFIKWDEAEDNDWLLLIYIKNNLPSEGIIIEDKSNDEKNIIHELKATEIFKASDLMVDSLTQLIAKERTKRKQEQKF